MSPRQLAFLLIPAAALFAQEPPRNVSGGPLIPEQACFDVRHCDLTLRVDPATQSIDGALRMRALATADCARIALDLDAPLAVYSIEVDGVTAGFDRAQGRVWIEPTPAPTVGHEFTVAVAYGGKPRVSPKPPWVGGFTWAKTRDGKPWIATSCQGEGADLWWPCKDHPSDKPDTFDLFITVPEGLVVASNGTLQGEPATVDGATTFHWHVASPISNYCIALNIAPYVCIKDTYTSVDGTKVPVEFYALPQNEAKARHILPQFLDHVRFFETTLGPYPFRAEKYGVAETPHLGMEHQSIIAYGNRYLDMRYDWLHNHELSHEWFGNLITCRDWKDMWLHEGFGTYMQPLYLEKRFGRAAYDLEMKKQAHCDNLAPVAPRINCDSQQIYFDHGSNDLYYKGSWVLHTLRWELGDELFFSCLRRFCYPTEAAAKATDGSQVRCVDTDDFVRLCSEIAGRDMAWFFEVYVRRAELPRLEVTAGNGGLDLAWVTPEQLPFELAVPVAIGEHIERVAMPAGRGHVDLHGHDYEVDPEHRLLMATK